MDRFEAAQYPAEVAVATSVAARTRRVGRLVSAAPDRPDTATEVEGVETVARAMADVLWARERENLLLPDQPGHRTAWQAAAMLDLRNMARAAIQALAARRPATETEQAVERCRRLVEETRARAVAMGRMPELRLVANVYSGMADRIVAALGGAARDGDGQ